MVASRKTAAKKPVAKASAARKSPSKSMATRKSTPKKRTSKHVEMQSFHLVKDELPFTTFRITRQTLYWVILVSFIIFAQLWIISLQVEVASLLDAQQAQLNNL